MNELAIGVLALAALAFVALPLVRPRNEAEWEIPASADAAAFEDDDPALAELLSQRDATYRAIKEIELDRQIGNLSEEDYADLRERYKLKALGLLKAIEEHAGRAGAAPGGAGQTPAEADAIELAIAKRRARKAGPQCPGCGTPHEPGDRFCRSCGQLLALCCPSCGEPHGPEARFCVVCGTRLPRARKRALART